MRMREGAGLAGFSAILVTGIVIAASFGGAEKAKAQGGPDPGAVILLGQALFRDTTLSNPPGMACISCHDPDAGFSYPESDDNLEMGPVEGIVAGRFGNRKPPSASYATYLPVGPPHFDVAADAFVGGLFWDGRAANANDQAKAPFLNVNEMNDTGPAMVVEKVHTGPTGQMFRNVYGQDVFNLPTPVVYDLISRSIAAFEASPHVSPFTSKYDAYLEGRATLTDSELKGLRLTTGTLTGRPGGLPFPKSAHCMDCHGISDDLSVERDIWTNSCYANLGVPKNPDNPFYRMTNRHQNPDGYNPVGTQFVDLGLGGSLYPAMGLPPGDFAHGDPLGIDGTFKAPSLRNVDKRPYPEFVKAYMHNGVFKSLKEVVHFYNTRNLTTVPGEVIDFTKKHPYQHLKGRPLWAPPEFPSALTMINAPGLPNTEQNEGMAGAEVGNLLLTDQDEDDIVAFLKTLSDGYFTRN